MIFSIAYLQQGDRAPTINGVQPMAWAAWIAEQAWAAAWKIRFNSIIKVNYFQCIYFVTIKVNYIVIEMKIFFSQYK